MNGRRCKKLKKQFQRFGKPVLSSHPSGGLEGPKRQWRVFKKLYLRKWISS